MKLRDLRNIFYEVDREINKVEIILTLISIYSHSRSLIKHVNLAYLNDNESWRLHTLIFF